MSEEQRSIIQDIWDKEIRPLPGGDLVELCAEGFSVIRMEYILNRKYYEMTSIGHGCGRAEIRRRMLDIYGKLMKAAGREKK